LTPFDFDPEVIGIASQPFRLLWDGEGGWRSHVPDFFVRRVDGSAVVVDVRPAARTRPTDMAVFTATGRACVQAVRRHPRTSSHVTQLNRVCDPHTIETESECQVTGSTGFGIDTGVVQHSHLIRKLRRVTE
jgi:hypothetical protein